MKWLTLALALLVVLIQYPLWLGKGGWLRVWEVDRQITAQRDVNGRLKVRNGALDAEVRDLKQGTEAIEERARSELGMIRQDEIFFQVLNEADKAPAKHLNEADKTPAKQLNETDKTPARVPDDASRKQARRE
jgi:cell division protein FtsB